MQLEIGNLREQMIAANKAYGHGVGANEGSTKEQLLTMEIETNRFLAKHLKE